LSAIFSQAWRRVELASRRPLRLSKDLPCDWSGQQTLDIRQLENGM
jgi:hypothetical protein